MKKHLYFSLIVALFFVSCNYKDFHYRIAIANDSEVDIYVNITVTDKKVSDSFKDYLSGTGPAIYVGNRVPIVAGTTDNTIYHIAGRGGWEDRVGDEQFRIFFFDADIVDSTPWETVVKDNLILECRFMTLDEMSNNNWIVRYPN